ncbi:hypothetical protein EXIGLDRAFT_839589, partial [Exidia glandulosa HHB12029]
MCGTARKRAFRAGRRGRSRRIKFARLGHGQRRRTIPRRFRVLQVTTSTAHASDAPRPRQTRGNGERKAQSLHKVDRGDGHRHHSP